nr:syndecan-like [Procambarus clarkii]
MRIYLVIGCIALVGPVSQHKVLATTNEDLYLADFGSGDGIELEEDSELSHDSVHHRHNDADLTHLDEEGSGDRSKSTPYESTYDEYTDDEYPDNMDPKFKPPEDDEAIEGSGSKVLVHTEDHDPIFKEDDVSHREEVIEEIIIDESGSPTVEEQPPTTPPPTLTDNSDMEGNIQIHTTVTDERQVSIFAQPGILAAFIGGAVVGLLCAILLVMFIVYRMRKKDEGSYPLDEPKRMPLTSSYSPNDKEIYA